MRYDVTNLTLLDVAALCTVEQLRGRKEFGFKRYGDKVYLKANA